MNDEDWRILAVDDSHDVLQVIQSALNEIGYPVDTALDARTAKEKLRATPPALLLLDVMLPDGNGFELCREWKKSSKTRDIPVIFLTALTFTGDKMQAFSAGAADYLAKPVLREELQARVSLHMNLLRQQRTIDALRGELAACRQAVHP